VEWFHTLDTPMQVVLLGGVGAFVFMILGAGGWMVRYWLRFGKHKVSLQQLKLESVIERLDEVHQWASEGKFERVARPVDQILWICEEYGKSPALIASAQELVSACDVYKAQVARVKAEIEDKDEVLAALSPYLKAVNDTQEKTRAEALKSLEEFTK